MHAKPISTNITWGRVVQSMYTACHNDGADGEGSLSASRVTSRESRAGRVRARERPSVEWAYATGPGVGSASTQRVRARGVGIEGTRRGRA